MKENNYINYVNEKELRIGDYKLNDLTYNFGSPILLFNNIEANERILNFNKLKEKFNFFNYILDLNKLYFPFIKNINYLENNKFNNENLNNIYFCRNFNSTEIIEAINIGKINFVLENFDQLELLKILLNHLDIKNKINIYFLFKTSKENKYVDINILNKKEITEINSNLNNNIIFKGFCLYTNLQNESELIEILKKISSLKNEIDVKELILIDEDSLTGIKLPILLKNIEKLIKNLNLNLIITLEISNYFYDCYYLLTSVGNEKTIKVNDEKITCLYLDYDLSDGDYNKSVFLLNIKAILKDKKYIILNKNRKTNEKHKEFKYDIISRGDILLFKNFDIENFVIYSKLNNLKNNVFTIELLDNKVTITNISKNNA